MLLTINLFKSLRLHEVEKSSSLNTDDHITSESILLRSHAGIHDTFRQIYDSRSNIADEVEKKSFAPLNHSVFRSISHEISISSHYIRNHIKYNQPILEIHSSIHGRFH